MHVAIILDRERLRNERAMLHRLCVGLIAEGARLTRLVPEGEDSESEWEKAIALASRIDYSPNVLPWMRVSRRDRLVERFDRNQPNVIFACGEDSWSLARDLGAAISCPVAVDVWSVAAARNAPRLKGVEQTITYLAATEPIAELLRRRVGSDSVMTMPPGVTCPPQAHVLASADRQIGVVLLGRTLRSRHYRACFEALSDCMTDEPTMHLYAELDGPDDHGVWRLLRSHDLLPRTSTLTRAMAHHALLAECDLVLRPEPTGEVRSILLELMGAALPLIAVRDAALDFLIPDQTACFVAKDTPDAWAVAIRDAIAHPERARRIGEGARRLVLDRHRTSSHAEAVFQLLTQLVQGDSYHLPDSAQSPI